MQTSCQVSQVAHVAHVACVGLCRVAHVAHVAHVAYVAHVAHVGLMQEPCQLWSLPQTATEVNTCKTRANFGKHDMNFTHVARV